MCPPRDSTPSENGLASTLVAMAQPEATVDVNLDASPVGGFGERYDLRDLIGRGGMGEVHACRDGRIGRQIAMKVVREERRARDDRRQRFLREARIQGQLEHPGVLPVYDLGQDPDGHLYFTMKRSYGVTLAEIIQALREGDQAAEAKYPRSRRLGAFLQVCQCVHYAHVRGVLHRDLKPANIMLGEFGEVYVLDWGLAKTAGTHDRLVSDMHPAPIVEDGSPTQIAGVMGTPGYLSPEQARAEPDLDARSDLYSLGAILFELLSLERLHPGKESTSLIEATLLGADARISARVPDADVPAPLETICVKATALEPADRYRTARELHDAVEAFLEGDRDLERRRALAAHHAAEAEAAAALALSDAPQANTHRVAALREVGRALALDPEHTPARRILADLLLKPPQQVPREAEAEIERSQAREARFTARAGAAMLLATALLVTLLGLDRSGLLPLLPAIVPLGLGALLCLLLSRQARPTTGPAVAVMVLVNVGVGVMAGFMGPMVLTPGLALAAAVVGMNLSATAGFRALVVVSSLLSVLVPAVLEMTGVIASSYANRDGVLVVMSRFMEIPERPYPVLLLICSLLAVLLPLIFVWRLSRNLGQMRDRVQLLSWQFGQLVPGEARPGSPDQRGKG